jgi:hypothetical protein
MNDITSLIDAAQTLFLVVAGLAIYVTGFWVARRLMRRLGDGPGKGERDEPLLWATITFGDGTKSTGHSSKSLLDEYESTGNKVERH